MALVPPIENSSGRSASSRSHEDATPDISALPFPSAAPPRRVYCFTDLSIATIAYQHSHVMRPLRVLVLQSLLHSLGLLSRLTRQLQPVPATTTDMEVFHRRAYIECLRQSQTICQHPLLEESLAYQNEFDVPVGGTKSDCPLFEEVWQLVASQAGGSLSCAEAVRQGETDIAIHWGGGMHHAAAAHASGFCFVNDIVLCIRRLLKTFLRVLYVDLDVHHGDGVEAAFLGNPRVVTLSLHQFGDRYFPGTGDYVVDPSARPEDSSNPYRGAPGLPSFAVNVPLPPRTGDSAYLLSFLTAFTALFESFDPEVVVVQCGADTIAGDLIGRLCVTTHAHTACVRYIVDKLARTYSASSGSWGKKLILLGGGGYHVLHTVQCWALHTATALGVPETQLPVYIPRTDPYYMEYRRMQQSYSHHPAMVQIQTHQAGDAGHTPAGEEATASSSSRPQPPPWLHLSGGNRPTLHVELDWDVDHPLPMEESLVYYRQLCRTMPWQLKAIRQWRCGFDRRLRSHVTFSPASLDFSTPRVCGNARPPRTTSKRAAVRCQTSSVIPLNTKTEDSTLPLTPPDRSSKREGTSPPSNPTRTTPISQHENPLKAWMRQRFQEIQAQSPHDDAPDLSTSDGVHIQTSTDSTAFAKPIVVHPPSRKRSRRTPPNKIQAPPFSHGKNPHPPKPQS